MPKNIDIDAKRCREKILLEQMISIYCRKHHKNLQGNSKFCNDCYELLLYAQARIDACPVMKDKTFCSNCKIHCYKADKRDMIRQIMRFSGPRMLIYHPKTALLHLFWSLKNKRG